jgi:hypothetical protein
MPVYIDFNIRESDNARELLFNETTGTYNASSNAGGWGSPNDAVGTATTVELKITPPDGTQVTLDLSTNYPTADSTIDQTIRTQDLSLGTDLKFADGLWLFEYEVTTSGQGLITNTQTILLLGQARICVFDMLADVDLNDCDGSELRRALEANTYLHAAIASASVGDTDKFTELLALIDNYCNNEC